jgi:hypothetical protein
MPVVAMMRMMTVEEIAAAQSQCRHCQPSARTSGHTVMMPKDHVVRCTVSTEERMKE